MKFATVCSGIEACSAAWHPLGWQPQFFSEIEPFPCLVLAHHYPTVPNLGDMTKWQEWPDYELDVICGGTPCQSFSVAGLRKGMADPRGNLALTFLAIVDRYRPTWLVWENVPGVLSSNGGRDFGAILGGMVELGYSCAYRVLDAQYFGVAQRRRRVFVVGHLGNANRAAAVLFERHSLSGHPAPGRKAWQGAAASVAKSLAASGGGIDREDRHTLIPEVCPTLRAGGNKTGGDRPPGTDVDTADNLICMSSGQANAEIQNNVSTTLTTLTTLHEAPILAGALCKDSFTGGAGGRPEGAAAGHFIPIQNATRGKDQNGLGIAESGDPMFTLDQGSQHAVAFAIQGAATRENPNSGPDGVGVRGDGVAYTLEARQEVQAVAHALRGEGFDASEDGTGRGTPLVPVCVPDVGSTLTSGGNGTRGRLDPVNTDLIAFDSRQDCISSETHFGALGSSSPQAQAVCAAFKGGQGSGAGGIGYDEHVAPTLPSSDGGNRTPTLLNAMQVRRLTPRECERLQGFPDDYTLITVRNKPAADGPRYKALGNSMAVPVMQWIGKRIDMVEATA